MKLTGTHLWPLRRALGRSPVYIAGPPPPPTRKQKDPLLPFFFFLYIIRKGLIESISTWWRRNYNMKYLKSYKQPTDISALLGRHKKSWWDGRVCQVFRSHLGHDKRKVLTNEFKVKSTCHPNSVSLNYLANGSKAARNVVMIIISTIKEKIPEKKKGKVQTHECRAS